MNDKIFSLLMVIAALQLLAPVLAIKIKKRFESLGYSMTSNPYLSMMNISRFWSETSKNNKKFQDPTIRNYLYIYYSWWVIFIIAFVSFVALDR
jgi:hypothetical protein